MFGHLVCDNHTPLSPPRPSLVPACLPAQQPRQCRVPVDRAALWQLPRHSRVAPPPLIARGLLLQQSCTARWVLQDLQSQRRVQPLWLPRPSPRRLHLHPRVRRRWRLRLLPQRLQ